MKNIRVQKLHEFRFYRKYFLRNNSDNFLRFILISNFFGFHFKKNIREKLLPLDTGTSSASLPRVVSVFIKRNFFVPHAVYSGTRVWRFVLFLFIYLFVYSFIFYFADGGGIRGKNQITLQFNLFKCAARSLRR